MTKTSKRLLSVTILLLSTVFAYSQATNSADLTGSVTDTTGAVLPGVTVTVKNIDKDVARTYVTNQSGLYDTGPIVSGDQYIITFSKKDFETLQRGPMILHVGRIGLDVQLGVAQASQQVVVNEAAPLMETTSSELATTLPSETLQLLPQVGSPDWQQWIVLLPGTRGTATVGTNNPGMGATSANGSLPFSAALLDGAVSNSPQADNVIQMPVFESIGEVKITDSMFSAQYPTGGILYNQISKSGTNKIHGTAYDYLQNKALKAASYAFGTGKVSDLHYNDFGANLGGPIIKNRFFVFFNWDHTISHSGGSVTFITVPTTAMREGDFTALNTIYDPTTQTVDKSTGVVTRKSFNDEYGNGNKIPSSMFDSVAKNIQKLYPSPNLSTATNNYQYTSPSNSTMQKYFGRIDADLTPNNRLTGSASHNQQNAPVTGPACPIACDDTFITGSINSQLSDVWVISQHFINEARAGFYGEYDHEIPNAVDQGWPDTLGLKFAKSDAFPYVYVNGYYSLSLGTNFIDKENVFDLSDTVTLIYKNHVIHAGGQALIERVDATVWGGINSSSLTFTGGYSASDKGTSSTTGSSYADFLLGYVQGWSASSYPEYGGRKKSDSLFIQDDWKFKPNLTFNLGLRWEARTGWSEVQGNARTFDPDITNKTTHEVGAMWYQSTHENNRTALQKTSYGTLLPRVGLAYQYNPKTTIRAGFGMYTYPWTSLWSSGIGSAKGSSGSESDSSNNLYPVVMLSSDGNTNYQGSYGKSINDLYVSSPTTNDAYNGQGVGFELYKIALPILKQWNLDLQRQISTDMQIEVSYIGSRGTHLPFITDLNQVPESKLSANDSGDRPYSAFQSITGFNLEGLTNYHSLQAQISRRMSNGLDFNFNYTWSHMLSNQDSSGWNSQQGTQTYQNAYDPSANYGASNFDIRNMFKARVIYELPFGNNKKYFNSSPVFNEIAGGWSVTGTWMGQGGTPFTPYMLTNNSYAQSSNMSWFPNQVGNPKRSDAGINGWFNTSAYQSPTAGTFGDTRRNSVYGPGLHIMNMAMRKRFPIYRNLAFDFSANASNVLNHPSFGQPDRVIGTGHTAAITSVTTGGRSLELVGKIVF